MPSTLRRLTIPASLALATACAGSGASVPEPSPDRLAHVKFTPVTPRTIIIAVTDARAPKPANTDSVVATLRRAVTSMMLDAGITADASAPNALHVTVRYPDAPFNGLKPEDCIELTLELRLADGSKATSGSAACFAQKNVYGLRIGNDATQVYENAINLSMRELDRVLGTLAAPAAAPQSARRIDLSDTLAAQIAAKGGIAWTAVLRLQWKDFKGVPVDSGREAALSKTGLVYAMACAGANFQYGVVATFIPADSWVKKSVRRDSVWSGKVLAHERTHFDITEIGARALRQRLMAERHPCSLSNEARNALGAQGFDDDLKIQAKYDSETGHGVNPGEQLRWERWAKAKLDSLAEYSGTVGMREN